MDAAFQQLPPLLHERLGRARVLWRHSLHTMFDWSDARLAALLDAYPRDRLGVFLTSDDPRDASGWRRGLAGALSGAQLIERVHQGRLWLNLRAANLHLPQIADAEAAIRRGLDGERRSMRTFRHDLGLLISGPQAQVRYHFDVAMVALFHLRGAKRMWLYPPAEPFLTQEQIERAVLRTSDEMLDFDPAFDKRAEKFDLTPGDWITWPQNAPHRIRNGEDLNVSLSMEFLTPRALLRANQHYANGVLRRSLRLKPALSPDYSVMGLSKAALARALKIARPKPKSEPWTPQFDLSTN